jgi:riboflavin biosynthesis pyrimidine reductase
MLLSRALTISCIAAILALVTVATRSAASTDKRATYIATAEQHVDLHALHRELNADTARAEGPLSRGEVIVHHGVRAIVVKGGPETCSELLKHDGIDHCEPDSIFTTA